MSRVGQKPIAIPEGVKIAIQGAEVKVTGPKGELTILVRSEIKVAVEKDQILVSRQKNDRQSRSLHGLTRSLIANAVTGVVETFSKTLKLEGTGYRVKQEGDKLVFSLGFSHPVVVSPIKEIEFEVKDEKTIKIIGIDKALVGQVAAQTTAGFRGSDGQGKGIRYEGEEVKLKPGKAGKAGAAGFAGGE